MNQLSAEATSNLNLSANTQKAFEVVCKDFNRYLLEHNKVLSPLSVDAYLKEIASWASPSTYNSKKFSLKKLILSQPELSASADLILAYTKQFRAIPTKAVQHQVSVQDCLSKDEVEKLLESSRRGSSRTRKAGLIIAALFKTGCRVSELTGILMSDCLVRKMRVRITIRSEQRQELRMVRLEKDFFDEICSFFNSKEYLFEGERGGRMDRTNVHTRLFRLGKRVLNKEIHPHILRHSKVLQLIQEGKDLKFIARFLGHSNSHITGAMYAPFFEHVGRPLEKGKKEIV